MQLPKPKNCESVKDVNIVNRNSDNSEFLLLVTMLENNEKTVKHPIHNSVSTSFHLWNWRDVFSEDGRVLNGYVTNPNPTPTLTPNRNPNPNQINEKIQKETTLKIDQIT